MQITLTEEQVAYFKTFGFLKFPGLFAEDEFLVQDTSHSLKWSYPVADPSRQQYTYRIVAIKEDGSLQEAAPVTTSDLLIVKNLSA